jgi:hypothetical protein
MARDNAASGQIPWILQLHQDGEINLDKELSLRFAQMPTLSTFHARQLSQEHVAAMLAAQDGSAVLRVDVDLADNVIQYAFSYQSMLCLRFVIDQLGDSQHTAWIQQVRRERNRPIFCWGPDRWNSDFIITVGHPYFTNLYAFSTLNFEAATRLTTDVTQQLLNWLESLWQTDHPRDETLPRMTTW